MKGNKSGCGVVRQLPQTFIRLEHGRTGLRAKHYLGLVNLWLTNSRSTSSTALSDQGWLMTINDARQRLWLQFGCSDEKILRNRVACIWLAGYWITTAVY